ncbi:MAG: mechanosensitive ion channel family protein [Candidatus Pacebacteria bacterium]|nr:mechanosensitive ion channel family protein [Candidatus Paceibacterota bacterium]
MNISILLNEPVNRFTIIFGNTVQDYVVAFVVAVLAIVALKVVQGIVLRRLASFAEKTKTDIDDTLIRVVRSLKPAFYYVIGLWVGLQYLVLSGAVSKVVDTIFLIVIAYQVVVALHILVEYTFAKRAEKEGKDVQNAYRFLSNFIKWGLWVVAILAVLSNLGINITSLIAGLGIGGIAVALAMQNILSDLFSSFAIYLDKPFEVGDFIVVGNHSGTVERIGIKTTRLRALQGEEIVISNKELTSARVQNMKKLEERRATFSFGVVYDTKPAVLEKIPGIVREILEGVGESRARLDRVHLAKLADSSIDFDVVYYVPTSDYTAFMDTQQEILLKLFTRFGKEKIKFAYPTQTVFVAK